MSDDNAAGIVPRLLHLVANKGNPTNPYTARPRELSEALSCSMRSVKRAMARARKLGLIQIRRRHWFTSERVMIVEPEP